MFDVYAETLGRQILNVAYRGFNQIVLSEIFIYRLRLRRRFNYYEVLRHQSVSNFRLPIADLKSSSELRANWQSAMSYSFLTKHLPGNALINSLISSDNSAA